MNTHDPMEAVAFLKLWIEESFATLNDTTLDVAKERYRIVLEIIDRYDKPQIPVPEEIQQERKRLVKILETSNEERRQLAALAEELSTLSKETRRWLSKTQHRRKASSKKSPPTKLKVTFPDGTIFYEEKAVNTFVKTLQYIGLEQISQLSSIRMSGRPLVSTEMDNPGRQVRKIDGYFVETHSNTREKARILKHIARTLDINMSVTIL